MLQLQESHNVILVTIMRKSHYRK